MSKECGYRLTPTAGETAERQRNINCNKLIDKLNAKLDFLKDKELYWPNSDGSFMKVRDVLKEEGL